MRLITVSRSRGRATSGPRMNPSTSPFQPPSQVNRSHFSRFRNPPGLKVSPDRSTSGSRTKSCVHRVMLLDGFAGTGAELGHTGWPFDDRVLDDDVGAHRHQRRVELELRHHALRGCLASRARPVRSEGHRRARAPGARSLAEPGRRSRYVIRGCCGTVVDRSQSSIETTCPWPSSSQIDARNRARPPSPVPVSMIQSGRTVVISSW